MPTCLAEPLGCAAHDSHSGHASDTHIQSGADDIHMLASAQGSAADVATAAMLSIGRCQQLRDLGWKLLLQVCYALRPIAACVGRMLGSNSLSVAVLRPVPLYHRYTMR